MTVPNMAPYNIRLYLPREEFIVDHKGSHFGQGPEAYVEGAHLVCNHAQREHALETGHKTSHGYLQVESAECVTVGPIEIPAEAEPILYSLETGEFTMGDFSVHYCPRIWLRATAKGALAWGIPGEVR